MERTPGGTSVGVDDPYDHVDRCDHLTADGRCRFALERDDADSSFAAERAETGYRCVVASEGQRWADCPHFRARTTGDACARCDLRERRVAHDPDCRPLLEEHHLAYGDDAGADTHEITVMLCRWCHAKVHRSWARISDDVSPDPEAIAEREERIAAEQAELGFRSAADLSLE